VDVVDVTERLMSEFERQLGRDLITRVVTQCRHDLHGAPTGALPELLERAARQRLLTLLNSPPLKTRTHRTWLSALTSCSDPRGGAGRGGAGRGHATPCPCLRHGQVRSRAAGRLGAARAGRSWSGRGRHRVLLPRHRCLRNVPARGMGKGGGHGVEGVPAGDGFGTSGLPAQGAEPGAGPAAGVARELYVYYNTLRIGWSRSSGSLATSDTVPPGGS